MTEFAVTFFKTSLSYTFRKKSIAVDNVSFENPVRQNKPISEKKLITCCAGKKTRSFQISLLAKHLEGRKIFVEKDRNFSSSRADIIQQHSRIYMEQTCEGILFPGRKMFQNNIDTEMLPT